MLPELTLAPDAPMLHERMTFGHAIDLYIADMRAEGRVNSDRTEIGYRACLNAHADDVGNRDPRYTNRQDVKTTLRRWTNPNTQRVRRACLVSFYDWAMQELEPGRKDNPARQTRAPRVRKSTVYRMTMAEVAAFMLAARTQREQRIAYLGVGAGVRLQEFQGLQGRHFKRPGWIWISADIGKGGRARWVPVLVDLFPLVEDIRRTVAPDEYVIPAQRWRDPGHNTIRADLTRRPASRQVFRTVVEILGQRAGISAHLHPHLMRHAFGDHVARYAGMRNAQFLLGHANVGTTEIYVGEPTLDELAAAIDGLSFLDSKRTPVLGSLDEARTSREAPTGIEPVNLASRPVEPDSEDEPPQRGVRP
jgi:integrase/recombinase XerC